MVLGLPVVLVALAIGCYVVCKKMRKRERRAVPLDEQVKRFEELNNVKINDVVSFAVESVRIDTMQDA